jgi:hypothetical protein
MQRALIVAIGLVVVGWRVPVAPAAADNPVCIKTGCAFLSPSGNISCEINYQTGNGPPDGSYCQTLSPPRSVHMNTDGTFQPCTGDSCLGNPSQDTPTLPYGQSAAKGPFNCRSEPAGVTCTVRSGRGFTISNLGITPVG